MGINDHRTSARIKNRRGEKKNKYGEAVEGFSVSFTNSFNASANGCSNPYGPTTFGPLRNCIYPRTFRSTKVRKATEIRIGTKKASA